MSKDHVMDLDLASVDHVLTTTRSVRQRLDLDSPVPLEMIEEAIQIALQAPTRQRSRTTTGAAPRVTSRARPRCRAPA